MTENHDDKPEVTQQALSNAAGQLYRYLLRTHWNNQSLAGPDPGVRFNARLGRFIKSYTPLIRWSDNVAYIQAQKYWIMCNSLMGELELAGAEQCKEISVACAEYLLSAQRPEGYWEHPNREWKGRIATVEGNYGAMGLLDAYAQTGEPSFLDGAKRWYRFAVDTIGFHGNGGFLAIKYFANRGTACVPNISISAIRTFALLSEAANDQQYLEYRDAMVRWLKQVQLSSGELPYAVVRPGGDPKDNRIHFLCYQYNAFELLNLIAYYRLTQDEEVVPIMTNLTRFVAAGVTNEGACRYDCFRDTPEVSYYTAAVAAALKQATETGLGDYAARADCAYQRLLSQQSPDGSMAFYSARNYHLLRDRRSYPRYLAMTLYMFLIDVQRRRQHGSADDPASTSQLMSTTARVR